MAVGEEDIWEFTYGEGDDKPPTGMLMKEEFRRHYYYSQSPLEVTLLITSQSCFITTIIIMGTGYWSIYLYISACCLVFFFCFLLNACCLVDRIQLWHVSYYDQLHLGLWTVLISWLQILKPRKFLEFTSRLLRITYLTLCAKTVWWRSGHHLSCISWRRVIYLGGEWSLCFFLCPDYLIRLSSPCCIFSSTITQNFIPGLTISHPWYIISKNLIVDLMGMNNLRNIYWKVTDTLLWIISGYCLYIDYFRLHLDALSY